MIDSIYMEHFLRDLKHDAQYCYDQLRLIAEAVSYPKAIPKNFWNNRRKAYEGVLYFDGPIPKANVKEMYSEIVTAICEILQDDSLMVDHYARFFHALAILKVPKNSEQVSATRENPRYNLAYYLWALDDGSKEDGNNAITVAWYVAEIEKNNGTLSHIITGKRHAK